MSLDMMPASLAVEHQYDKFGLLTVDGYRAHEMATGRPLQVYLDGVKVTDRCVEANDIEGYVVLYCQDKVNHDWAVQKGGLHVNGNGTCLLHIRGDVNIEDLEHG